MKTDNALALRMLAKGVNGLGRSDIAAALERYAKRLDNGEVRFEDLLELSESYGAGLLLVPGTEQVMLVLFDEHHQSIGDIYRHALEREGKDRQTEAKERQERTMN